jgi:cyanate lyase
LHGGDAGQGPDFRQARGRDWRFAVHRRRLATRPDGLTEEAAAKAAKALGLKEAEAFLIEIPYRGSLGMAVPTDPTIYRFYEIVQVYGTTLKELIHEEFGDGIMSAIDFDLDIARQPNPNGDRVKIVMTGKFLKYKKS